MFEMMHGIPDIFWIFAGIALVVIASGYAKGMKSVSNNKDLEEIRQRLDRIELHLDLKD